MVGSKYRFIMTVLVAAGTISLSTTVRAVETEPGDQSAAGQPAPTSESDIVQPSEAIPPKSPLRLNTIDYQDAGDRPGKLTVAGIALPGRELYLFLDDQPFTNTLPDDSGNWSVESEMKLDTGRHTFRADQYDAKTQMLVARAMVTFERAKQSPDETPAPKAATP